MASILGGDHEHSGFRLFLLSLFYRNFDPMGAMSDPLLQYRFQLPFRFK